MSSLCIIVWLLVVAVDDQSGSRLESVKKRV
jgi:hypothetical protein